VIIAPESVRPKEERSAPMVKATMPVPAPTRMNEINIPEAVLVVDR
jgi:hypothetical protein